MESKLPLVLNLHPMNPYAQSYIQFLSHDRNAPYSMLLRWDTLPSSLDFFISLLSILRENFVPVDWDIIGYSIFLKIMNHLSDSIYLKARVVNKSLFKCVHLCLSLQEFRIENCPQHCVQMSLLDLRPCLSLSLSFHFLLPIDRSGFSYLNT